MTCTCPSCGGVINYSEADAGNMDACPHCSARITLPASNVLAARRQPVRRTGFLWGIVKALGLLTAIASFVWVLLLLSTSLRNDTKGNAWSVAAFASLPALVGIVFGWGLFALARRRGLGFACSNCGTAISRSAVACRGCGAAIE